MPAPLFTVALSNSSPTPKSSGWNDRLGADTRPRLPCLSLNPMPLEFTHWFAALVLPRAAWLTPRCGLWGSLRPGAAQAVQYQPLEGTGLHLGPNQSCCYSRDKLWAQRRPLPVPSSHTYTAGAATMTISTHATDAEVQSPGLANLICQRALQGPAGTGPSWRPFGGQTPTAVLCSELSPEPTIQSQWTDPTSAYFYGSSPLTSFPAKQHPTSMPLTDLPFPQSHPSLPPESQPSSKRTSLLTPRRFQLQGTALSFVTRARERAQEPVSSAHAAWRKRAAGPGPDPR